MKKGSIIFLCLCISVSAECQPDVEIVAKQGDFDSLKTILLNTTDNSEKITTLNKLSWLYVFSFPDSALKYSLIGIDLAKKERVKEDQVSLLTALSQALSYRGDLPQALKSSFDALRLAELLENENLIAWCLGIIGSVYFYAEDYSNALAYFTKTKNYPNEYKSSENLYSGFIGETYFHLDQLDSAMIYTQRAYDLNKSAGLHFSVPILYMGMLYEKKGLLTEALQFYRATISKPVAYTDSIKTFLTIANCFKGMQMPDSGIFYAREAFRIAEKTSSYLYINEASFQLKEFFKAIKQPDSVLVYQNILLMAKDSLFGPEKVKQMLNFSFTEQQRQQEILEESERFKNKMKTIGLSAGLLVFVIIASILFRSNRFKTRTNALLKQQKEKVESVLSELKATQNQLIQSEKMASLGELTAGIAHEIQNPLNFVNNFSEVNAELIEELDKELKSGNQLEAIAIAADIKVNEQKISLHGKRADAIVKGMLQHSRNDSGEKMPTDINTLAEEYLRLAYHSFRGKELQENDDNSFKVELKTHFDQGIGKVALVPQDFGRVLLNLYNNAFYSVNEKAKTAGSSYQPTVELITGRENGFVRLTVRDNGKGIPDKIINKIFQPFFTTKPTGEGTGLGLSLAYDIIKSNNGNISVTSIEGEGSEFIIDLII